MFCFLILCPFFSFLSILNFSRLAEGTKENHKRNWGKVLKSENKGRENIYSETFRNDLLSTLKIIVKNKLLKHIEINTNSIIMILKIRENIRLKSAILYQLDLCSVHSGEPRGGAGV